MIKLKIFLFLLVLILGNSCSKENIQKSTIKEKSLDLQVLEAYQGGLEASSTWSSRLFSLIVDF